MYVTYVTNDHRITYLYNDTGDGGRPEQILSKWLCQGHYGRTLHF